MPTWMICFITCWFTGILRQEYLSALQRKVRKSKTKNSYPSLSTNESYYSNTVTWMSSTTKIKSICFIILKQNVLMWQFLVLGYLFLSHYVARLRLLLPLLLWDCHSFHILCSDHFRISSQHCICVIIDATSKPLERRVSPSGKYPGNMLRANMASCPSKSQLCDS